MMTSAVRFINQQSHPQFSVVPVVNYSTPLYDLYHQLPQLNSYQTFKPTLYQQSYQYPNPSASQDQSQAVLSANNNNLKFYTRDTIRPNKPLPKRDEGSISRHQSSDNGPHKNRRDGWGPPGYGGNGGGGGGSVGQSPAISALALLGFLFFLNLIQTSLQNNRNMLTTSTTTTVTTNTTTSNMMTTGTTGTSTVAGRNGRVRRRRGFGYEELKLTPVPIPTHPNRQVEQFLLNKDEDIFPRLFPRQNKTSWRRPDPPVLKSDLRIPKIGNVNSFAPHQNRSYSNRYLRRFKRLSMNCLNLLSCKLGRSLFSGIGPTAGLPGFVVRMIGERILPRATLGSWKNRLVRALTYGWRSRRNCGRIYRRCALTNFLIPQNLVGRKTKITRRLEDSGG